MGEDKLYWVYGNPMELAIPLQLVHYEEGGKETKDYEPSKEAAICVELQSVVNSFCYEPISIVENVLHVFVNGNLPIGVYAVVIHVTEPSGTKRRSKLTNIIEICDENKMVLGNADAVPDWATGSLLDGTVYFYDTTSNDNE